jgi:hypothetical protein
MSEVNRLIAEAFVKAFETDPAVRKKFFDGMRNLVDEGKIKDPHYQPKPEKDPAP